MVAGIEEHDEVILHRNPAWHGMGHVVEEDILPVEATKRYGIDWLNVQQPLFAVSNTGDYQEVDSHVANFRSDSGTLLGVVSKNYRPIQNIDMAEFCEALLGEAEGTVTCESVGTIQNGKKVWFLLKGEKFAVANGDQIYPYVCVSNGHDGTAAFRVTPTTIRAVCMNTLHMIIPKSDSGKLRSSAIAIRHTVNVMDRIAEARHALKHYTKALEETKELIHTLSAKDVTKEEVQQFFMESYTADFGAIPTEHAGMSKQEKRTRGRAVDAYGSFSRRFDDEKEIAGSSMWNAFNAYSGLVQNDKKSRGKNDTDRVEKRVDSNLFGLNATRTNRALERAFSMVG